MHKGTTSMMTGLQAPKGLIAEYAHCAITVFLGILLIRQMSIASLCGDQSIALMMRT